MAEKGLDVSDGPLRNSVVYKVVQALRHATRRRAVVLVEKRGGVCVWGILPVNSCTGTSTPSTAWTERADNDANAR